MTGHELIVDMHGHLYPAGLPGGPGRWPTLEVGADAGRIMRGDTVFREVRPALWDLTARLGELDAAGIDVQVVSPVPVTLTYWAEPRQAAEYARALNDGLAAQVADSGGRLRGLGTVPLQDTALAVDELTRVMTELGLRGAEIGTVIGDHELDAPSLRPFFEAAEALGAVLFVHPMDGGKGAVRRTGQPYDFGLGMLTDTALATAALVFGGVLEDFPGLRIALAHGCGTFSLAYPRLKFMAQRGGHARADELVRSLWVDSLVFDPAHLPLLVERFGEDHVMVGTDHPFMPGRLSAAPAAVRDAAHRGLLTERQASAVLGANAARLFGLGDAPSPTGDIAG